MGEFVDWEEAQAEFPHTTDWIMKFLDAKEHELIMETMMREHEWWYGVPVGPPAPHQHREFIGLQAILGE